MFLNKTQFKKWIKNAYNHGGLTVGMVYGGLVIKGNGWITWTENGYIPNWVKAAVMEYTGELPGSERAFKAQKDEMPQYEVAENEKFNLPERFRSAKVPFLVTPVTCEMDYSRYRLLQCMQSQRIIFLGEAYYDIIDLAELGKDENAPLGPSASDTAGYVLYWKNAHSALAVCSSMYVDDPLGIGERLEQIDFGKKVS